MAPVLNGCMVTREDFEAVRLQVAAGSRHCLRVTDSVLESDAVTGKNKSGCLLDLFLSL